jgi:hypothetical protein
VSDLPLDPSAILAALAECRVDFVLIGALAVGVHAEVRATGDVDVMVPIGDRANRKRLAQALEKLNAQQLPGGLGGVHAAAGDHSYPTLVFRTRYGKLDVLYKPDGSDAYPAVKRRSLEARVAGQAIAVAGKDDLIRMKLAAGRPEDLVDVANMTGGGGRARRVRVAMRLARGADAQWACDLADARVKLFDSRGRVWTERGALKLEASRSGLSAAQLEVWANELADRLAAAGVVSDGEPAVEIEDA